MWKLVFSSSTKKKLFRNLSLLLVRKYSLNTPSICHTLMLAEHCFIDYVVLCIPCVFIEKHLLSPLSLHSSWKINKPPLSASMRSSYVALQLAPFLNTDVPVSLSISLIISYTEAGSTAFYFMFVSYSLNYSNSVSSGNAIMCFSSSLKSSGNDEHNAQVLDRRK